MTQRTTQEWWQPDIGPQHYWDEGTEYECVFRGNTLIDMTPPNWSRYHETRAKYEKPMAPKKRVTRFATPVVVRWWWNLVVGL